MSATSKLQRCPRLDSTKCWRLRSIIFEAVVVTARLLLLLSSLQLSIVYLVMYIVHSMLCSSIVVGIQAQPDSISLSQLYYDRSKGYLSSIIHNKNHNATRYFRAKLWLWLSLIQFFSPPRGIWLVASNMEYDGCRQLRYCCCAMPRLAGCCSSFYTARTLHRRIKLWTPGKNDFQNAGPPSS